MNQTEEKKWLDDDVTTEQMRDWRRAAALKSGMIPERYHCGLEGIDTADTQIAKIKKGAENYALRLTGHLPWGEDGPYGLWLWSDTTGSGKTHIAYGIVLEMLSNPRLTSAFCTTTLDLQTRFISSYGDTAEETANEILREALDADLVFLDDFGTEKPSPAAARVLYQIINERNQRQRPMIFTSNYPIAKEGKKGIGDRLGEFDPEMSRRLMSRIAEHARQVDFPEVDYRLERNKNKGDTTL